MTAGFEANQPISFEGFDPETRKKPVVSEGAPDVVKPTVKQASESAKDGDATEHAAKGKGKGRGKAKADASVEPENDSASASASKAPESRDVDAMDEQREGGSASSSPLTCVEPKPCNDANMRP